MPTGSLSESLSSLLAATVAFAIGTSVVLRDRKRDQFVLFAVFCFNLGLFHLGRFFYTFSGLTLFGWFAQTISLLLPWTASRSLSSFVPTPTATGARRRARLQRQLGLLLVVAQTVALFFPSLRELQEWKVVPWVLGAYVIVGLLLATTRVWRAARLAEGTSAAPRLRYLFIASLVTLVLGSPWVPSIGPIVTAVYLYFVAQTLVRERLLDLPEVALRIVSISVLVVVVTSLYALLLLWIPARDASNRSLFVFNAAVASFAVLVLLEPVRTEIESRLEGWLFRDRTILRRILVQLRSKLLNVIDPDEMAKLVMAELQASGRVTQASLYLIDRQGTALVLSRHLGPVPLARLDLATRRPLIDRMQRLGTQLRDVLQRERERARQDTEVELDEMLETLDALKASLALPIFGRIGGDDGGEPELLGALFVDDERLLEPFSREEIELFEGVVAQAATTIQNSAVYEARKERDRLAALGEMAAGLAHEIRNPLGAIKGAVQVMESFEDEKPGPQTREFLDVIVEEVDRLNRVVSQFLTYSRPFKGEHAPIDPAQVVAATLRLLPEGVREHVHVRSRGPVPKIHGDGDALRQVLHNLVLNALDATSGMTEPAPSVEILLSVRHRGLLRGDAVAIDVRDNGPGLSARTMTNLFVPFHTTKSGGTGLGLPISQRIVENHQGVIEVANNNELGARFTVLLPAREELSAPAVAIEPGSAPSSHAPHAAPHTAPHTA
ncbi:MAG: GAF domain-containing protein, partial [Deltaproteobacteria bacterium]|nr:GAF domain-containing protein [Nannocystaceae bacterium]